MEAGTEIEGEATAQLWLSELLWLEEATLLLWLEEAALLLWVEKAEDDAVAWLDDVGRAEEDGVTQDDDAVEWLVDFTWLDEERAVEERDALACVDDLDVLDVLNVWDDLEDLEDLGCLEEQGFAEWCELNERCVRWCEVVTREV